MASEDRAVAPWRFPPSGHVIATQGNGYLFSIGSAETLDTTPPICNLDVEAGNNSFGPAPLDLGGKYIQAGFNGTIQLDTVHDFGAMGLDPNSPVLREFIPSEIPVGGAAAERTDRTAFSPNQSLFEAWAQTDTDYGQLRGYTRLNLAKSAISTEFQVYMVYLEWGWLKGGLDYTLWFNQAAAPDTLDFEGPNSIPYVRFPQIRLKVPFEFFNVGSGNYLFFGLEDAPSEVTLPDSVPDANVVNRYPSIIAKWIYEPQWAHVELAGLYRRLKAQGTDYSSTVDGWGLALSGQLQTFGEDNLILAGEVGQALGAYSQDTDGLGLDAAPRSATDQNLKAIPAAGAWAGYQHWWNSSLRSTATYGFFTLDNNFDPTPNPVGTFHQTQYASVNIIWSPIPSIDMGVEYIYGRRRVTNSTAVDGNLEGENHRIQATVRWNFAYQRSSGD